MVPARQLGEGGDVAGALVNGRHLGQVEASANEGKVLSHVLRPHTKTQVTQNRRRPNTCSSAASGTCEGEVLGLGIGLDDQVKK